MIDATVALTNWRYNETIPDIASNKILMLPSRCKAGHSTFRKFVTALASTLFTKHAKRGCKKNKNAIGKLLVNFHFFSNDINFILYFGTILNAFYSLSATLHYMRQFARFMWEWKTIARKCEHLVESELLVAQHHTRSRSRKD
uniref:Uncharacterized protein n=1 Tax=Glossina austeni TaxID=7395 RepID=A0A1A9V438_GLOAU